MITILLLSLLGTASSLVGRSLPHLVTGKIAAPSPGEILEELLNHEDLDAARSRLRRLSEVFPGLDDEDFNAVVDRSPVLLTLEEEGLERGLSRLRAKLPWCDPSYIVQQRLAGIDLLMAFVYEDLKVEPLMEAVGDILSLPRAGNRTELMEFLRRCPFVLLPKYQRALAEQVTILDAEFGFKKPTAKTIFEKFPSLLEIDLRDQLHSLNASLRNSGISLSRAALGRVVKAVPRVLVQDVERRIQNLRELYPRWHLDKIIAGYPRVLTHKYAVLDSHYQVSKCNIELNEYFVIGNRV